MKQQFLILAAAVLAGLLLGPMQVPKVEAGEPESVRFLQEKGLVKGYEDGSLRLENSINRAEFLKIVMQAKSSKLEGSNCFTDVKDEWFASNICAAKEAGFVKGYPDGSFGPGKTISLVEALKILTTVFELPLNMAKGTDWYSPYVETLADQNVIPASVDYYTELLTRGEAFEILWRVMEDVKDQPSTHIEDFKGVACNDFAPEVYANIDMERVRAEWLAWNNEVRAAQNLPAFTYNEQLDRTAFIWSSANRDKGVMDHKRSPNAAYYDYYAIQSWFKNLGVTFVPVGNVSFTENIGRGPYSCREEDCTDELLRAIRYTFDFYMAEAGKEYRPHYNSVMSTVFKEIGVGIVITGNQYYLTIHYATQISPTVAGICD